MGRTKAGEEIMFADRTAMAAHNGTVDDAKSKDGPANEYFKQDEAVRGEITSQGK